MSAIYKGVIWMSIGAVFSICTENGTLRNKNLHSYLLQKFSLKEYVGVQLQYCSNPQFHSTGTKPYNGMGDLLFLKYPDQYELARNCLHGLLQPRIWGIGSLFDHCKCYMVSPCVTSKWYEGQIFPLHFLDCNTDAVSCRNNSGFEVQIDPNCQLISIYAFV